MLLGFAVLLLLGLATYTRVETAVAGNALQQAQAREHALLGLNVALAQLQQHAGPDQRVTATAESISGVEPRKRFYTGVWGSRLGSDPAPLAWLASRGDAAAAVDITAPIIADRAVTMVGPGTDASAGAVPTVVEVQDIRASGVPGQAAGGAALIGRYGWWVGDQGVKAAVAVPDRRDRLNYPPYDAPESQRRLTQHVSLGPAAPGFEVAADIEPRSAANRAVTGTGGTMVHDQLAFLRTFNNAETGVTRTRQNFQAWSPGNFNVFADSGRGGLRQDLSVAPSLLGASFAAWADYGAYMENPAAPLVPAPIPAFAAHSLRRRYRMQPASAAFPLAPVLSFFGLTFSLRNDLDTANPTRLEVAARSVVGLWNPYTSALVPETGGLQLRIFGLPDHVVVMDSTGNVRNIDLQATFGAEGFTLMLPWTPDGSQADRSSWLPGRVYNWSAENTRELKFYARNAQLGTGIIAGVAPPLTASPSHRPPVFRRCTVARPTRLRLELWRVDDAVKLAEFTSPEFEAFQTSANELQTDHKYVDFGFIFRLPDSDEIPFGESARWLQATGRDPREQRFPSNGFVVVGNGPSPALFGGINRVGFDASYPDLLLDRYTDAAGRNYNEDIPVFELPRGPLLSLGSLQHFYIGGARPFAIGNSWGDGELVNGIAVGELFDRFFFSGMANGVAPVSPEGGHVLPNPLLHVVREPRTGRWPGSAAWRSDAQGYTSRDLLQSGAFNLNSLNRDAWSAVLRGVRFPAGEEFTFLNATAQSGTAADLPTTLAGETLLDSRFAAFARFAHSAQEVFKADPDYLQSEFGGGTFIIDTPHYRRGLRTLSRAEVSRLAEQIAALSQLRAGAAGPFRTVREFLAPAPEFTLADGEPASLLEKAIENAAINPPGMPFSSQFLTQADIMTALAPVLFARSDTFLIRAYGEAVNPVTGAVEGRAWCEATVQRMPEYFRPEADDAAAVPAALTSELNRRFGRRCKIVSFRWLARSEI